MDIIQADLLPEMVWDKTKERRDPSPVATDLEEDQAAPLEHTTLEDYAQMEPDEGSKKKPSSGRSILQSRSLGHDTETPGGDRTPPFYDPDDV